MGFIDFIKELRVYGIDGYDRYGFNQDGLSRDGFDREGYDRKGFDTNGFDRDGFGKDGYMRYGFDFYSKVGFDKNGYDRYGFDEKGYGIDGYDKKGWDKNKKNKSTGRSFDINGFDIDGYNVKGHKKGEIPKSNDTHRTFLCPSCNQKIRVSLPLPKSIGKCTKCHKRFQLSFDDSGNLLVFSIKDTAKDGEEDELTIDKCYSILDIDKATATPQIIKSAYKKQMQKYHPDRVEHLGTEFRHIAEKRSKMINLAYELLQK